jgi:hypothetical protein
MDTPAGVKDVGGTTVLLDDFFKSCRESKLLCANAPESVAFAIKDLYKRSDYKSVDSIWLNYGYPKILKGTFGDQSIYMVNLNDEIIEVEEEDIIADEDCFESIRRLSKIYLSKQNTPIVQTRSSSPEVSTSGKKEIHLSQPEQAETENSSKRKTVAEAASTLKNKYSEVESFLRELYSGIIVSGELSEKEIQALVYVLARIPEEKVSSYPINRAPSRLYDWAVVRSSITLPYLGLKSASDNLKFDEDFSLKSDWGFKDDKFILPAKESLDSDESFWGKLSDLITVLGYEVEYSAMKGETVPNISLSSLAKNNYFGLVFIRLIELAKSPTSATIRTGTKLSNLDIVKNHVDYVALNTIYINDREKYGKLPISASSRSCQRSIKSVKEVPGKKNKTELVTSTSHVGYILAERLSSYCEKTVGKSPEAEPFFRFIKEIIFKIISKTSSDYVLPKSFFAPPNTFVRKFLRKGPEITSKGTTKPGNTYVPFSFAKSSECQEMPESIRKSLTSIGANISKNIDSINSYPVLQQNHLIDDAVRFVKCCYALSDDIRKQWQTKAVIPDNLKGLSDFTEQNIFSLPSRQRESILNDMAKIVVKTTNVHNDNLEQEKLKASVCSMIASKRSARKSSSK